MLENLLVAEGLSPIPDFDLDIRLTRARSKVADVSKSRKIRRVEPRCSRCLLSLSGVGLPVSRSPEPIKEQLEQLETVNDDLRREVDRLATDDGVREAAREELGFVEVGERRESIMDLPPVPTDLPDGWPYDLVSDIVELRTNPPTPALP